MHVSLAWLAYVPVPGLAVLPVLADGHDRFVRFHAWQGGVLVGLLWVGLILLGLLGKASDGSGFQTLIGILSLLWILAGLAGIVAGVISVMRGTHGRIRPVYDLLAAFGR